VLSTSTSLRAAERVLEFVTDFFEINCSTPSWYAGRLWLIRLGYYKLTRPKKKSDDWIWIIDHTVQWGNEKCLAILGVRQSALPIAETILNHQDVEPLALLPVTHSNGDVVYQQLEDTISKTGVPRQIVSDHGSDVKSGIEKFCNKHPETCFIYDITHKSATVLKRELATDTRWSEFIKLAANTRIKVQQTELAAFAPPNQRSKARYMNIGELVKWATDKLLLIDYHQKDVTFEYDPKVLVDKLGWLIGYRKDLVQWNELLQVVKETENFVKFQGIYRDCEIDLVLQSTVDIKSKRAKLVRDELLDFVEQQAKKTKAHERLLGSSEIIESVFGKLKKLEQDQSKSGFTLFLLSMAASVAKTTKDVVHNALETVPTKQVFKWFKTNVGQSLHSKRVELNSIVKNSEQKRHQKFIAVEA